MKIEVLYFASARDLVGTGSAELEIPSGADVRGAIDALVAQHPALETARGSLRFAVNEEFVELEQPLNAGDRLALLPPVSGG